MDSLQESASMTFADAHRTLTGMGYTLARTKGSHHTYKKSGLENVTVAKHGKDIGPGSYDDVKKAVRVHTMRNLAEAVSEGNLILAKELFEEILKEKLYQKLKEKKKQLIFKESNGKLKYSITQPLGTVKKDISLRYSLEKN